MWHFKCKPFSRIIRGIVGWVWFTYKEIEPHCDSAIVGNMVTWKPESELFIKGLPFLRNCEATWVGGITLNPVYSPSSIYCIITRHSSVIFFRQPIIKKNACNLYLCLLSYFWKWKKMYSCVYCKNSSWITCRRIVNALRSSFVLCLWKAN